MKRICMIGLLIVIFYPDFAWTKSGERVILVKKRNFYFDLANPHILVGWSEVQQERLFGEVRRQRVYFEIGNDFALYLPKAFLNVGLSPQFTYGAIGSTFNMDFTLSLYQPTEFKITLEAGLAANRRAGVNVGVKLDWSILCLGIKWQQIARDRQLSVAAGFRF